MHFIEQMFGLSPDAGAGTFEVLLVLMAIILVEPVAQLVYVLRKR